MAFRGNKTISREKQSSFSALIVDDDSVIRALMTFILRKRGFKAQAVEGVPEALVLLDAQSFDVLFTDLRLAEKSGLELAAEARLRFPQMLIVLMTATVGEELADMLRQVKIDYRLTKPFSLTDVEKVLDQMTHKRMQAHT